jgi:hypothetical protein
MKNGMFITTYQTGPQWSSTGFRNHPQFPRAPNATKTHWHLRPLRSRRPWGAWFSTKWASKWENCITMEVMFDDPRVLYDIIGKAMQKGNEWTYYNLPLDIDLFPNIPLPINLHYPLGFPARRNLRTTNVSRMAFSWPPNKSSTKPHLYHVLSPCWVDATSIK